MYGPDQNLTKFAKAPIPINFLKFAQDQEYGSIIFPKFVRHHCGRSANEFLEVVGVKAEPTVHAIRMLSK
jgi:hypothetical protein